MIITQINIDVGPLLAMGFTGATVEGGTYERRRRNIQTFYEGPEDIHVVGRNASKTKPAKFLVVLIKNNGAPELVCRSKSARTELDVEAEC